MECDSCNVGCMRSMANKQWSMTSTPKIIKISLDKKIGLNEYGAFVSTERWWNIWDTVINTLSWRNCGSSSWGSLDRSTGLSYIWPIVNGLIGSQMLTTDNVQYNMYSTICTVQYSIVLFSRNFY